MVLVDYSDSESDEQEPAYTHQHHQQDGRKRKADYAEDEAASAIKFRPLPPLPASFHSLYATNVRSSTTDDPSLHAGRTRQVPHVVGNWQTHVYLEWYPSQSEVDILDHVIKKSWPMSTTVEAPPTNTVHSFLHSNLGTRLPLHISLSAPLVLETIEKGLFEDSIKSKLGDSRIKHFRVEATKLDWAANHDKTRFFLVLRLSKPQDDELNRLLSLCNATAEHFGQPQLYVEPTDIHQLRVRPQLKGNKTGKIADQSDAFHISIAWTLDEPNDSARQSLAALAEDQLPTLKVSFHVLKLKIGNAVIDLPLE